MGIFPPGWLGSIITLVDTSAHSLVRLANTTDPQVYHIGPDTSTGEVNLGPVQVFQGGSWLAIGTCVIAAIITVLISYTFKVILILCIVEASPAVYLPIESKDPNERKLKPISIPGINTPKTYVTNSIRRTIRHLRSEAGVFSAWRGFNAHIALIFSTAALRIMLRSAFGLFLPRFFARLAAEFLSFILLARLSMTVTHIIISKNQKNTMWFSRVFATPWSTVRRTLPAMAHFAVGRELGKHGMNTQAHLGVRIALVISGVLINLFIVFPMMVALIRVQASLLPDSQEGIISFDRSFGKADGTMGLSSQEALRSVGPAGWKRITTLVVKFWGIVFSFTAILGAIFLLMLFGFGGCKGGVKDLSFSQREGG